MYRPARICPGVGRGKSLATSTEAEGWSFASPGKEDAGRLIDRVSSNETRPVSVFDAFSGVLIGRGGVLQRPTRSSLTAHACLLGRPSGWVAAERPPHLGT